MRGFSPDGLGCAQYEHCAAAPVLKRASRSSTIALSDDGSLVVTVNPEDDSVSIFSTADNSRLARVVTGDEPSSVVIHPDSKTAFVANRASATVVRVANLGAEAAVNGTVDVGSEPTGLALTPTGAQLFVAELAEGRVSVVDTASLALTDAIESLRNPRALAVTNDGDDDDADELVIIPEFFGDLGPRPEATDNCRTGRVHIHTVSDLAATPPILFAPLDSGFQPQGTSAGTVQTSPNQLYSVAIRGGKIYVTSISASPKGPPVFNGNVHPVVYAGDLATRTEDTSVSGTTNLAKKVADAIPEGQTRFFLADLVDIDFVPGTGVAYAVSRGADVVQRVVYQDGVGVSIGSAQNVQIDIGKAFPDGSAACQNPIGVAVNGNATRLYVNCWITRRLGVIDLATQSPLTTVESSAPPPSGLETSIQKGRRFYFTGRGRWANSGWSGCGSCHPDGLTDNITWSFAAGPRQTTSMDGTFSHGSGPQKQRLLNWTAIFEEMHDFERNTRGVSGGKGAVTQAAAVDGLCGDPAREDQLALGAFLAQPVKEVQDLTPSCVKDWDDINEFVKIIRPPRGRRFLDPASVARGEALFGMPSAQVSAGGCVKCHGGPGWTISRVFWQPASTTNADLASQGFIRAQPAGEDNTGAAIAPPEVGCVLRKVGTFGIPGNAAATDALELKADGTRAQGNGGFNVPSLYGLALGPPYFHHGQARTLEDVFTDPKWELHLRSVNANFLVGGDAARERADILSFLLSIDADKPEQPLPDGADTCPAAFP
ncbi:MAG: beta-propeller fold lactonase family protein [Planctomycetes bacterium]|nr:beta-propeller fold lactonase family protein [Planctomycetota bacterium]